MDDKAILEAALFISAREMSTTELSKLTGLGTKEVIGLIEELRRDYKERGSGIHITREGNSFKMEIKAEIEEKILHLAPQTDISEAMLKTLALIAHDQPIKQSELVRVRGNRVYYYVKKLRELELITTKKEGRTKLLTTTPRFKDYFRIESVKKMAQEPTVVEEKEPESDEIVLEMK